MVGIVLQNRLPPFWYFLLFVLLCVSIFLNGCGELALPMGAGGFVAAENAAAGGVAPGVAEAATEAVSEEEFAGFKRVIESEVYDGKLTVFLRKDVGAWPYPSVILEKYAGVEHVWKPDVMTAEEEEERVRWEEANGMKLFDWGRVYYFHVADRTKALALQRELMARPEVWLVYPGQRGFGAHAGDGTPSLVDRQIYLGSAEQAGLEVEHAWEQGIYGQGAEVHVNEMGYFFDHEKFALAALNRRGAVCTPEWMAQNPNERWCSPSVIAHASATIGVLHAQHHHDVIGDDHGVRGMVPGAWTESEWISAPKGSIYLYESVDLFLWNGGGSCIGGNAHWRSCAPRLMLPGEYIAARETALMGDKLVIESSGNGAVNLDAVDLISEELRAQVCAGAGDEAQRADCERHSQFVLAGAHQGDRGMVEVGGQRRPVKESFSNCGSEVELSSWGERVVTTAWRHPDGRAVEGYDWDGPNGPPNDAPERAYTNQFGSTSAGAALVAGAAALVQSYFKDLAEGVANDGLFAKTRYLRPAKLKEILIASGLPVEAADGCGVGVLSPAFSRTTA